LYLVWRLRGRPIKDSTLPPRLGLLCIFAYLAGLSHILLDFTNNYGVRPFWPLSERWYARDIVFIVDPVILILLLGGLFVPMIVNLAVEKTDLRRKATYGRLGAGVALVGILAYWGVRDFEHHSAVRALETRQYKGASPIRASAYPFWWSPFSWNGVVETQNFFVVTRVDSRTGDVDLDGQMQVRYKPEETPITLAAKKTYLGRVYLDWAKYPLTQTEPLESGYVVRFQDLRFDYPDRRGKNVLFGTVQLDNELHIVEESFGTRTEKPVPD
jgi:inner membrane protein